MATPSPWSCKCGFHLAFALLCLSSISLLQTNSVSVNIVDSYNKNSIDTKNIMNSKLVLGSRPPRCVNRCFNCRPCMAVLVVPPRGRPSSSHQSNNADAPQDDEGYYLLSWKCLCKNKFFQP